MELDRGNCRGMDPDVPLAVRTEAEEELNRILLKQLNTKVTLVGQFNQHRDFDAAGQLVSLPANSGGLGTASQLESLQREDEGYQRLVRAGLTSAEIQFFLRAQKVQDLGAAQQSNFGCEPAALQRRLNELQDKVIGPNCQDDLQSVFSASQVTEGPEEPFAYIAKYAKKLEAPKLRIRKGKKRKNRSDPADTGNDEKEEVNRVIDPSVFHAVVPLEEQEILANRLTLEQIRQIPKFASYSPGESNHVLYVKNLHPKASVEELISLFGRYDSETFRLKYRLLSGKMRGQAFVTFPESESAEAALKLVNGYKLRGQPAVIQFGRKDCKT